MAILAYADFGAADPSLAAADGITSLGPADGRGVQALIRQYLKMGGRLMGFTVDPSFSNALDALVVTDLRSAPLALLERCMGRPAARSFLEKQNPALRDPRIARFPGAAGHMTSQ